ncbi:MAG: hypothetical protein O2985_16530, partial [Proteobacteria bacterium]|nr:hypothetical protein [Pseudomonadota bacterium]
MANVEAARSSFLLSGRPVLIGTGLLVAFLALYPISWLIFGSFRTGTPLEAGVWTLENYIKAYSDRNILKTIGNTLIFAGGQTIGAVGLGSILAWIVTRTDTPGRTTFEFLTLV